MISAANMTLINENTARVSDLQQVVAYMYISLIKSIRTKQKIRLQPVHGHIDKQIIINLINYIYNNLYDWCLYCLHFPSFLVARITKHVVAGRVPQPEACQRCASRVHRLFPWSENRKHAVFRCETTQTGKERDVFNLL